MQKKRPLASIHQRSAEFTAAAQRVWNGPEEQLTANQVREGFSRLEISQYKTNKPYRMQIYSSLQAGNNVKGVLTTLEQLRHTL